MLISRRSQHAHPKTRPDDKGGSSRGSLAAKRSDLHTRLINRKSFRPFAGSLLHSLSPRILLVHVGSNLQFVIKALENMKISVQLGLDNAARGARIMVFGDKGRVAVAFFQCIDQGRLGVR